MTIRKSTRVLVAVILVIATFASTMCALADDDEHECNYKVVDSIDCANLRDTADKDNVLDSIPAGTPIYVIERGPFFSTIEYEGSVVLIYNELIEPIEPGTVVPEPTKAPEKLYTIEGTTMYRIKLNMGKWINVRRSKSLDADSAGQLYRGDIVYVKKISSDGWATIIYNKRARYIQSKWLELVTEDMEPLETPAGSYELVNPRDDNNRTVYLRKKPSVYADIRTKVRFGTVVEVVEDYGAWAKVYVPSIDKEGYMMTFYMKPIEEEETNANN